MVAITITLAAIIAGFVFGMSGTALKNPHSAQVTASQNGEDIDFTYISGDSDIQYLTVTMPDSDECSSMYNTTTVSGKLTEDVWETSDDKPHVGSTYKLEGCGTGGRDRILVTAHFSDGQDQIVLDAKV